MGKELELENEKLREVRSSEHGYHQKENLSGVHLHGFLGDLDGYYEPRSFMKSGYELRRYKDGWILSTVGASDDSCWAFLESKDLLRATKWLSHEREEIEVDVKV